MDQMGSTHGEILRENAGSAVNTLNQLAVDIHWLRDNLTSNLEAFSSQEDAATFAIDRADMGSSMHENSVASAAKSGGGWGALISAPPIILPSPDLRTLHGQFSQTQAAQAKDAALTWLNLVDSTQTIASDLRGIAAGLAGTNRGAAIDAATNAIHGTAGAADRFAANATAMHTHVTLLDAAKSEGHALVTSMLMMVRAVRSAGLPEAQALAEATDRSLATAFPSYFLPILAPSQPLVTALTDPSPPSSAQIMQAGMGAVSAREGLQAAVNSLQLPREFAETVNREIATHPENFTDIDGATEILDRIGENPGGQLLDPGMFDTTSAGTGMPQPTSITGGMGVASPASGLGVGSVPTSPTGLPGLAGTGGVPAGALGAGGSPIPALAGLGAAAQNATGHNGAGGRASTSGGAASRPVPVPAGMPRLANTVFPGAAGSTPPAGVAGQSAHPAAGQQTMARSAGAGGGSGAGMARGGHIVNTPPARGAGGRTEQATKAKAVTSQVEREGNLKDLLGDKDPVVPGVIGSWVFDSAAQSPDK